MGQNSRPNRSAALAAYETIAPFYDRFTAAYDYDRWLDALECLACEHGLAGRRLLDIGCGTGKSFAPLALRGYDVTACDISPAMVAKARENAPPDVRVLLCDMRALPADLGTFDLVTCLDDGVNYLLSERDLVACFTGVRRVLADRGVFLFDVNTLGAYRSAFAEESVRRDGDVSFRWIGQSSAPPRSGGLARARIEIDAPDLEGPVVSHHVQRHHPQWRLRAALQRAGLDCVAVRGQLPGARIQAVPDELTQSKLVYLARGRVTAFDQPRCQERR